MTIENLLKRRVLKALEGKPEARDEVLKQTYGITQEELGCIRLVEGIGNRTVDAAILLLEKARQHPDIEEGDESAQLTELNIAAVVEKEWTGVNSLETKTRRHIHTLVSTGEGHTPSSDTSRFKLPGIHYLREHIRAYTGNLSQAADRYPNFQVSNYDWLKSVRIPLNLGLSEYTLLGIIWADACPTDLDDHNFHGFTLRTNMIQGKNENDSNFVFYKTVSELVRATFNYKTVPFNYKMVSGFVKKQNGFQKTEGGSANLDDYQSPENYAPALRITSKAIYTWLQDDLGFQAKSTKYSTNLSAFPHFDNDEQKLGFLIGIIAAEGKLSMLSGYPEIRINSYDTDYLTRIKNLFSDLR
ncbi:MAG: hypothetical protein KKF65_00440, partial [Nanoarchaeota archaeon]|nr:hypothetical protein [Nanoarchaeota archaeon]